MLQKIFAIKDQKAECFNQPFHQPSHGAAERSFRTLVNDEKSTLNKYPKDFDLYYLGEWDDNNGKYIPLDAPQHIISAVNCLTLKQ